MDSQKVEYVALIIKEVYMYRIQPRKSNQQYKAQTWINRDPDWTGKLQVVIIGEQECRLRLLDISSNKLYAEAIIEKDYPNGLSFEGVSDSSRYFVICLVSPTGRKCSVGIGFSDRSDSFDLTATLNDHFDRLNRHISGNSGQIKSFVDDSSLENTETNHVEMQTKLNQERQKKAALDCKNLKLGDNEKIKINLNIDVATESDDKPKENLKFFSGGIIKGGLLPPPPKK